MTRVKPPTSKPIGMDQIEGWPGPRAVPCGGVAGVTGSPWLGIAITPRTIESGPPREVFDTVTGAFDRDNTLSKIKDPLLLFLSFPLTLPVAANRFNLHLELIILGIHTHITCYPLCENSPHIHNHGESGRPTVGPPPFGANPTSQGESTVVSNTDNVRLRDLAIPLGSRQLLTASLGRSRSTASSTRRAPCSPNTSGSTAATACAPRPRWVAPCFPPRAPFLPSGVPDRHAAPSCFPTPVPVVPDALSVGSLSAAASTEAMHPPPPDARGARRRGQLGSWTAKLKICLATGPVAPHTQTSALRWPPPRGQPQDRRPHPGSRCGSGTFTQPVLLVAITCCGSPWERIHVSRA